jgi:hypothetical protein
MICNFESMGAERVSYGFMSRKRKVQASVKVMKLKRGGEPFVLLADGDFRLLMVAARRSGSENLRKLVACLDFGDRASPCATLARCLGAGHVVVGHRAAEWLSREAKLLKELRPYVAEILDGGIK